MTLYMVLFFLGFILAIGLLAYTNIKLAELQKIVENLSKNLRERYSRPLTDLEDYLPAPAAAQATGETKK